MTEDKRRYDIDWIRVIVFDLLIFYHVGMLFVPWDFHLKNSTISQNLTIPMLWLNQWRLPMLFIVSGIGTYFSLSFRTGKVFLKERVQRLIIPLIFGIFVFVLPQVYIERLWKGSYNNTMISFIPHFFNGIYPTGNFSWHHLWFLPYLMFYSLIFLPVFLYIRRHRSIRNLNWFLNLIGKNFTFVFLMALPLIVAECLLYPLFPVSRAFYNDWYSHAMYGIFFLFGFILISYREQFLPVFEAKRKILLAISILLFVLFLVAIRSDTNMVFVSIIKNINILSWVFTIFGFAAKYLNKPSAILAYRNRAVYPFYIMHQTFIIFYAYLFLKYNLSIGVKFVIILILTYLSTWLLYHFAIRNLRVIHPLFGLKKLKRRNE